MRSASVSCSVYPQPSKQSSSSALSQSWSSHKAQPNLAAVGADVVSSQSPTGQPMERRKSKPSGTGQFAKMLRVSVLKHAFGVSQLRGGGSVVVGGSVVLGTPDVEPPVADRVLDTVVEELKPVFKSVLPNWVVAAVEEELKSVVGMHSTNPRVADAKARSLLIFILS